MTDTHATSTHSLAHSFAAVSEGALLASGAGVSARARDRTQAGGASSSSFAARSAVSAALRQSTKSTTWHSIYSCASAVRPSQVVDSTRVGEAKSRLQHLIRARYYDPHAGGFLSEDPLAFLADSNFYRYVGNNPTIFVDPYGYSCTQWEEAAYQADRDVETRYGEWMPMGSLGISVGIYNPPIPSINVCMRRRYERDVSRVRLWLERTCDGCDANPCPDCYRKLCYCKNGRQVERQTKFFDLKVYTDWEWKGWQYLLTRRNCSDLPSYGGSW
ncbi:MAG: RHS repeat-associated core domain-containing protein [Acidobacteriota bacterium]